MTQEDTPKKRIGKKIRKIMKNAKRMGKSARRGNSPSPYTKYNKTPYQYSFKRFKDKSEERVVLKRAA